MTTRNQKMRKECPNVRGRGRILSGRFRSWSRFAASARVNLRQVIAVALLASAALAVASLSVSRSAAAEQPPLGFRLITNQNNPVASVSRDFASDAFLKKVTRWPGGDVIRPFDLRFDSAARRQFSGSVLRRSVAAVRNYWQQKIFSGRDVPPPEVESDEAMIRHVQTVKGAFGYVSENAPMSGVRVVEVR